MPVVVDDKNTVMLVTIKAEIKKVNDTLAEHGKKIDKLNVSVFNGITKSVKDISNMVKEQVDFCKQIQEAKKTSEIEELKAELDEIKLSKDRRKSKWKQLPWWQKTTIIIAILVFLLRPDAQTITKTIIEMLTGADLGK